MPTLIQSEDRIGIAAISGWEVGDAGRARANPARPARGGLLVQALARPRVEEIPVTAAIALQAAKLPDRFPRDPADRLIYATARAHGAQLVTRDERLKHYDPAGTVW